VTETPIDRDDLNSDRLGELMCADLGWNDGLPLAAAGYDAQRYKKD
jgi:DNA polymerase